MTRIGKIVAVVASIALFAMPAATMSLGCILKAPSGKNGHRCHMMGIMLSPDQINAAPSDRSCCEISAANPELITVPRPSAGNGIVPLVTDAFLSDLPAVPDFDAPSIRAAQSPGAPPQAVLCTFLI